MTKTRTNFAKIFTFVLILIFMTISFCFVNIQKRFIYLCNSYAGSSIYYNGIWKPITRVDCVFSITGSKCKKFGQDLDISKYDSIPILSRINLDVDNNNILLHNVFILNKRIVLRVVNFEIYNDGIFDIVRIIPLGYDRRKCFSF